MTSIFLKQIYLIILKKRICTGFWGVLYPKMWLNNNYSIFLLVNSGEHVYNAFFQKMVNSTKKKVKFSAFWIKKTIHDILSKKKILAEIGQ